MPQQIAKIFRIVVGIVFLISSLLKAVDTAAFANLLSQYGTEWLGIGAPFIILIETILGMMLIFDCYPKQTAWATIIFLVMVSFIYLYGVTYCGISDCGCFGPLKWLNSKPWITFTRNSILLSMLISSLIVSSEESKTLTFPALIFMAIIAVAVMFMCGFSIHGAKFLQRNKIFQPYALADSPLANYVTCQEDSVYMVFAFSFTCPYCQNSIGNVNQYEAMGYVDKVIGIVVEDSVASARFNRLFEINFQIQEISELSMMRLTKTLPTTFFIRHDSIIQQYSGMVVSPALLLH